jgi:cystathionine beta-synthase
MFNDDWMRERGFLSFSKPKAIDIISSHKHLKLITIESYQPVKDALFLFQKYDISQIPVVENNKFVGSLNDNVLYQNLIENPDLSKAIVKDVMQKPFPIVDLHATIDEIAKLIDKENNAVLTKDMLGDYHIITKYDIIQAVSNSSGV